jgi:uncharacterized protein YjhX (UPF0386 family)
MSVLDFLRRLSNTVFGWPKIDESPLVIPGRRDEATLTQQPCPSTPFSKFIPLILLTLNQDPTWVPGNRVIQDVGGTLISLFTKEDMKLAETDYGMNYLWTQSVRVAVKSLVARGLVVMSEYDQWHITPEGQECARRILLGNNDAHLLYASTEPDPEPPTAATIVFVPEEERRLEIPTAEELLRAIHTGTVRGTKFYRDDNTEMAIPAPAFPPLGRDAEGHAYHRSAEVNVYALYLMLTTHNGTLPTNLVSELAAFYDGKLTEIDNEQVDSRRSTRFRGVLSNVFHDLKRQRFIARATEEEPFQITQKGLQAIVDALKENGIP